MKKFLSIFIIATFLMIGLSFAAKNTFVTNLQKTLTGKTWVATVDSIVDSLKGKTYYMTCETKKTTVECKTWQDGAKKGDYELWTFSNTKLDQAEYTGGKVAAKYSATDTKTKTGTLRNYYINCKDKARTKCDADVPGTTYWNVSVDSSKNVFKYIVKRGNKTRHTFAFTAKK